LEPVWELWRDSVRHIIEAKGVSKRFNSFTAVDNISFEVRAGECFGLLGPNGAGKTSAIRMIYGFSPLTEGTLLVFGMDIRTQWREIRARIGICQQENTLDPDLSVQENLHVFASYFRIPRKEARRRTGELLEFFALEKKSTAKVSELSGGLARRLTLARSLINNPELIILDEPTTGLDPQSRHLLWDRLQNLRARGTTLVLTTHYMEEAAYLCDRLMIMDHGTILVHGEPQGLVRKHVGESIIEVEQPGEEMMRFLGERSIPHEITGERVLIYDGGGTSLGETIRNEFCVSRCTFRKATLEDVFLRMTGRELRE
jgi:lipooligosaccharide transport system ATP-binding protein